MITADEAIQITLEEIEKRNVNKYIEMLDKIIKDTAKKGELEVQLNMPKEFDKIDILKLQKEYGENGIRLFELENENDEQKILQIEWYEKPAFGGRNNPGGRNYL